MNFAWKTNIFYFVVFYLSRKENKNKKSLHRFAYDNIIFFHFQISSTDCILSPAAQTRWNNVKADTLPDTKAHIKPYATAH